MFFFMCYPQDTLQRKHEEVKRWELHYVFKGHCEKNL